MASYPLTTEGAVHAKIAAIPREHGLDPKAWADYEEIDALETQYWAQFHSYVQKCKQQDLSLIHI